MAAVDFLQAHGEVRKEINQWVEEKTEGELFFINEGTGSFAYFRSRNSLCFLPLGNGENSFSPGILK